MRLKANNEAAIVSLRMKNYNELSDNKQVCVVPNPNSQSAAVLGRSFKSILDYEKRPLRECLVEYP